jgi:hypothetical protein
MILPSFLCEVRLLFKHLIVAAESNAICLKRNLVSIDSAFPSANTLLARSLSCSVFLNFGNVFWVIYCPFLLDNFRNKFIWQPSSPIFLQVCLLYPGWPILLLPPQQCFGCIWFSLIFFVFSMHFQPRIDHNAIPIYSIYCSLIHYYMPVPCCNTGRFQIILGSLIFQKVKLT